MTLIETTISLTQRLNTFGTLRANASEMEAFRTRAEQLGAVASSIVSLANLDNALLLAEVIARSMNPIGLKLRERILAVKDAYKADPRTIFLTDIALDQSLMQPLKKALSEWQLFLAKAWKEHVDGITGTLPDELLSLIDSIGSFAGDALTIRKLQQTAIGIANALPPPTVEGALSQIALAQSLYQEKERLVAKLEGIPDECLAFLRLVISRRARLVNVTEVVREWIDAENIANLFLISIGASNAVR